MMMGMDRMSSPDMPNMRMPSMNPTRGRRLFVSKGCVACHAINGVGGHDAANLDAHTMQPMMNPFEFAAKMWRMAPAMIYAQEEALGEQILFTGDELADIIAFVHNDEAQHGFSRADLTPEARKMMHHEHGAPGSAPRPTPRSSATPICTAASTPISGPRGPGDPGGPSGPGDPGGPSGAPAAPAAIVSRHLSGAPASRPGRPRARPESPRRAPGRPLGRAENGARSGPAPRPADV